MPSLDTVPALPGISPLITLAPGSDKLMPIGRSPAHGPGMGPRPGHPCGLLFIGPAAHLASDSLIQNKN